MLNKQIFGLLPGNNHDQNYNNNNNFSNPLRYRDSGRQKMLNNKKYTYICMKIYYLFIRLLAYVAQSKLQKKKN